MGSARRLAYRSLSLARIELVAGVIAAGALLAIVTLPEADRLQDHATARIGLDAH